MVKSVYNYKNFDFGRISFGSPHLNKNGSKTVKLFYPGNEEWCFQSSKCMIPFDPYSSSFCISLDLVMEKKILEFEKKIIDKAIIDSHLWFDKQVGVDEVEELFTPIVVQSRCGNYPPFMKVVFTPKNEFYEKDGKITSSSELKKNVWVKIIFKFTSIKINKPSMGVNSQKFKIVVELEQALIYEPIIKEPPHVYAFLEDSDEN